jgi:CubicO group peptidase (beta-lactamase class C family)
MLMNHTSGLVRYEFRGFTKDLSAHPEKVWRPEELVAYCSTRRRRSRRERSGSTRTRNYIVLGMIVEKVTGAKLNDEIERRLLRPLGLAHTVPSDRRKIPGLSQGYAGEGNPFGGVDAMLRHGEMAINPQFEWAGGGYASTAGPRRVGCGRCIRQGPDPARLEPRAATACSRRCSGRTCVRARGHRARDASRTRVRAQRVLPGRYSPRRIWFPGLGAARSRCRSTRATLEVEGKGSPRAMLVRLAQAFRA